MKALVNKRRLYRPKTLHIWRTAFFPKHGQPGRSAPFRCEVTVKPEPTRRKTVLLVCRKSLLVISVYMPCTSELHP